MCLRFSSLQVEVCVYYGGKALSKKAFSPHAKLSRDFFECVVWDKWYEAKITLGIPLYTKKWKLGLDLLVIV